ncbi:MAG: DNA-formamidopyrimidine glycosylase [Parcubacteria group bacterium]|nr:DNA-formamidopyrimidine glycosylase [Parcubacteria group bacterium]
MPELPEVETIVRDLKKKIIGRKIIDAWVDTPKLIKNPKNFSDFKEKIKNRKILDAWRRGKNIILSLSGGKTLLIHQKMTGHLLVGQWKWQKNNWQPIGDGYLKEKVNNYIHLLFFLDDNRMFALSDVRKFAKAILIDSENLNQLSDIKNLGPEPLDKKFTFAKFKERLKNKKGKIKQILLNQEIIAGLGNIYADETLFLARLHPTRRLESLNNAELARIYKSSRLVLKKAIRLRGTSISDYRDTAGKPGGYDKVRLVYRREGEKCPRPCQGLVQRIKIGNRSAHFCPKCQK